MTSTDNETVQHNLDLLREVFNELELHVQMHGIEFRDYFRVLTEQQYWVRKALPGWEDNSIVTLEPPTAEELEHQKDLKEDVKKIEEEAYEYVMKQDADQTKEYEPEEDAFEHIAKQREKKTEPKEPVTKNFCVDCGIRLEEYGPGLSMKECSMLKFCKVCNSTHIATHTWKEERQ
jgi:hypothetical protein